MKRAIKIIDNHVKCPKRKRKTGVANCEHLTDNNGYMACPYFYKYTRHAGQFIVICTVPLSEEINDVMKEDK